MSNQLMNLDEAGQLASQALDGPIEHIYVIAANEGDVKTLRRIIGKGPEQVRWLTKNDQLRGLRSPTVVIMPNWWRGGLYADTEQTLIDVQANIITVHFGLKPRFKGAPSEADVRKLTEPDDTKRLDR